MSHRVSRLPLSRFLRVFEFEHLKVEIRIQRVYLHRIHLTVSVEMAREISFTQSYSDARKIFCAHF